MFNDHNILFDILIATENQTVQSLVNINSECNKNNKHSVYHFPK